jgi:hypothetical protein
VDEGKAGMMGGMGRTGKTGKTGRTGTFSQAVILAKARIHEGSPGVIHHARGPHGFQLALE